MAVSSAVALIEADKSLATATASLATLVPNAVDVANQHRLIALGYVQMAVSAQDAASQSVA